MSSACVTPSAYPPAAPSCLPPVTFQPPVTTTTSTGTPPAHRLADTGAGWTVPLLVVGVVLVLVGLVLLARTRAGRRP